ncbi:hypothetical protein ACJJTC_014109 [Scirpophaga incertulas]
MVCSITTWICPACKSISRRVKSNINTPVKDTQLPVQLDDTMSCDDHNVTVTSCNASPGPSYCDLITMDKISTLLDHKLNVCMQQTMESIRTALREEIREAVRSEVKSEFTKVKVELSATTDFICAEQKGLQAELVGATEKLRIVEDENARLRADLHKINNRLSLIEKALTQP